MTELEEYAERIEAREAPGARLLPGRLRARAADLTEIAVYGLPIRMPHWSFGVRYIHQLVRQSMGHSKIFEVMFPATRAAPSSWTRTRSPRTRSSPRTSSGTPTSREQPALRALPRHGRRQHRRARRRARAPHPAGDRRLAGGARRGVLDAALALESHVDVNGELHRTRYPEFIPDKPTPGERFQQRRAQLPVSEPEAVPLGLQVGPQRTRIPPRIRHALDHRQLRAGARAVGARHLPGSARVVATSRFSPVRS